MKSKNRHRYTQRLLFIFIVVLSLQAAGYSRQQRQKPATSGRGAAAKKKAPPIPVPTASALDRISADSLRGHLSFIASDSLAGRGTPSPGLEIAAEYIAAQFRRAGLDPAAPGGESAERSYFQIAEWEVTEPDSESFKLTVSDGAQTFDIKPGQISFSGESGLELKTASLVRIDFKMDEAAADWKTEQIAGNIVLTEFPVMTRDDRSRWVELGRRRSEFIGKMTQLKAAYIVSIDRHNEEGRGLGGGRLIDPERASNRPAPPASNFMVIHDQRVIKMYDGMAGGESRGKMELRIAPVTRRPVKLKNVIGLLPGSDPILKDTYVIVSAHYDHVGTGLPVDGDSIYNGANDDGSGTVSVIELASALATLKTRPKRSIVFITWFGEERGLLGSRYYGRHPVFPLEKTIAMVNLEQVGRTDSTEGPQINNASMTGFDFTDLGPIFKAAGEKTGVTVYKHEQNSDPFFGRSDNQALADAGIPAHTLCVAFIYPDYHQPADHWEKIDYDNMARVNRMIGLSLITIANNTTTPKWNEANPKTEKYVKAWQALKRITK